METDGLARFNRRPDDAARRDLLACCAAPDWARAVAAGRPYRDTADLLAAADRGLADLPWAGIEQALAAHPRIGQRPAGTDRAAAWSRREQAPATGDTAAELVAVNRAYEQRFGHVFLIFAAGRTPEEMLAAARERLGHDQPTEQATVRAELGRITRLRVERLVTE